jgi:energy-coupling factor transporter ATP-binding protein EcfA2
MEIDEEAIKARDVIFKKLTAGKKPMPDSEQPHLVLTIGPPGAGKSTLARKFVAACIKEKAGNYVELDTDEILDYLSEGDKFRNLSNFNGRLTGVGAAYGWADCIDRVQWPANMVVFLLLEKRYNIIVHTHNKTLLYESQYYDYVSTLLYVAVSCETALRRASSRAFQLGRFLRPATEENHWGWENVVKNMWKNYKYQTPWYSLWADNLVTVNNDRDDHAFVAKDFIGYNTHPPIPEGCSWISNMIGLQTAIQEAHGITADKK